MKSGADEVLLKMEGLKEVLNGQAVQVGDGGILDACLGSDLICLDLECKALGMVQLRIVGVYPQGAIIVSVRHHVVLWLPVQEHVASVEKNYRIV